MATPLCVNVVELLRRPGSTKDVVARVATEDFAFDDPRIVDQPVDVALHLESLANGITVSGSATAMWSGECRRCLTPVRETVRVPLDELYQVTLEDPDAWPIESDQIDLLPMVRENILLAVPLGPLCRPDCPGFCPVCGADLSVETCGCDLTPKDSRWSVLDQLRADAPDDEG